MAPDDEAPGAAPGPSAVLGLGDRLRSARKARAISIAQAARALHLEESSVRALEEERFAALGAPVFVRGHLRRYAELLSLPVESVLDAYRSCAPESQTLPDIARRSQAVPDRIAPGAWVWWLAAALIVTSMAVVWMGT